MADGNDSTKSPRTTDANGSLFDRVFERTDEPDFLPIRDTGSGNAASRGTVDRVIDGQANPFRIMQDLPLRQDRRDLQHPVLVAQAEPKAREGSPIVVDKDEDGFITMQEATAAVSRFNGVAEALFEKLNTDGDRNLTGKELGAAVENGKFTGAEAQTIAALYKNRQAIAGLSNDQAFAETGITKADLRRFADLNNQLRMLDQDGTVATYLREGPGFAAIDKDRNGLLSKTELDNALNRKDLSKSDREAISFLQRNSDALQRASNDELGLEHKGISENDIVNYKENLEARVTDVVASVITVLDRRNDSPDKPLEQLGPDTFKQGRLNNCVVFASLAAIAATPGGEQKIRDMVKENADHTFTVTFPGDKRHPVRVNAPTEAEKRAFFGEGTTVIEKGFGEYKQQRSWGPKANTSAEASDFGENPARGLALLTGNSAKAVDTAFTTQTKLSKMLAEAKDSGGAVICGYMPRLFQPFANSETTKDGYIKQHAYSVIDFDPKGPEGGTVTVRNPWGKPEEGPEGVSTMSVKMLMSNFNLIVAEQKRK